MADVAVTGLGHGSFRIDSPGGKRVYLDPWLEGNPACPESEHAPERCDVIRHALAEGCFQRLERSTGTVPGGLLHGPPSR